MLDLQFTTLINGNYRRFLCRYKLQNSKERLLSYCVQDVRLKAIAKILHLQPATVHRHLARAREALDVHTSIQMLQPEQHTASPQNAIKLTPRGTTVFELTLQGVNDKKIADLMGISYSAVRRHKEKMLYSNGCTTMLELVATYYRNCTDTEPTANK